MVFFSLGFIGSWSGPTMNVIFVLLFTLWAAITGFMLGSLLLYWGHHWWKYPGEFLEKIEDR
jgi:hypothetical protein